MFSTYLLLLLLMPLTFGLLGIGLGRRQSAAVMGRLTCNEEPARGIKVKLVEKQIVFDRLMDEDRTDVYGDFYLNGSEREITKIDPKLNIYHKCNYDGFCKRRFSITIPDNFITEGTVPAKTFDIGTINLASKFAGEIIDCLN
ncbi:Transthyretin-like family protein [Oesophagostomum dentatum]|uniref:Transthyretin-like family protein n=1 Tax=Oesophagostomum dentatum TaxID=61180 RepID=A0A0B1TF85_OESDE|nr:Transthyretin-like family protein [Oesophagostomum dentatum]